MTSVMSDSSREIATATSPQIVFRAADDSPTAEGDLDLRPPEEGRRTAALKVVEEGLSAFPQGAGPITTLVLPAEPTLDDMLAATLAQRLLDGQSLPPGAEHLARHSALVREGLRGDDSPLEDSIEGLYLA